MNTRYKKGDKVTIKGDLNEFDDYLDETGTRDPEIAEEMLEYAGVETEITDVTIMSGAVYYDVDIDEGYHWWTSAMFTKHKKKKEFTVITEEQDENKRFKLFKTFFERGCEFIYLEKVIISGTTTVCFYYDVVAGKCKKVVANCDSDDNYNELSGVELCGLKALNRAINMKIKRF